MERLIRPANARWGMVLTHGAGSNADAPLLVALSNALAERKWAVLRVNLAFRQKRPSGPPHPSGAAADRAGLAEAITSLHAETGLPVYAGGHSYGGRQATMLAAEQSSLARSLLILSYPLHPPAQPAKLRVEHLPALKTPSLFVSGTKDPFGTPDELTSALERIPAPHKLVLLARQGHALSMRSVESIADQWVHFVYGVRIWEKFGGGPLV